MPGDPFYASAAWHKLRAQALRLARWKCSVCGAPVRGKGQSRVDHHIPRRLRPDLALDLRNLRVKCPTCDNRDSIAKGEHDRRPRFEQVDVDGNPPGWR